MNPGRSVSACRLRGDRSTGPRSLKRRRSGKGVEARAGALAWWLQLHGDDVEVGVANVLDLMRSERRQPECFAGLRCRGHRARVRQDGSGGVAPDEIAPAENVKSRRPLMGVDRRLLAGP